MAASAQPEPGSIVCRNVCIAYDREDVVRDVSVTIEPGAFLPFIGPNGAGKTTLLRAILGLVKPRIGQIITPFHERPPGYVPQQKALDPLFPVSTRQIVGMGLYPELGMWGRPNREQSDRLDRALEEFHLLEHERKTFRELSGGMRQKALIARAFVSGADVFVMDEPTSGLDHDSEEEVLHHLHRLSETEGKTVLIAHHGLDRIDGRASTVLAFNYGCARRVPIGDLREAGGPNHG